MNLTERALWGRCRFPASSIFDIGEMSDPQKTQTNPAPISTKVKKKGKKWS